MDVRRPLGFGAALAEPPPPADAAARPRGATRVVPPDDPSLDPRRPVRVARGVSVVLVVVCLVGGLQAVAMIGVEARRLWTAEREIARLEREVAELRRETADLIEIADRGLDDRFREHLARRQGYVYPNEVRYVIDTQPGPP
jgi:cell division protein FtsB